MTTLFALALLGRWTWSDLADDPRPPPRGAARPTPAAPAAPDARPSVPPASSAGGPAPVSGVRAPAVPAPAVPASLAALNAGRARLGLAPLAWDARLAFAAGKHARDVAEGRARPHTDIHRRVIAAGWPAGSPPPPGGIRSWPFGYSEAVWEEVPNTRPNPRGVEDFVEFCVSGPRGEGHVDIFRAGWTHAGVAQYQGVVVVDYGYLP